MSVLIWVQTACKDCQQMTKFTVSMKRVALQDYLSQNFKVICSDITLISKCIQNRGSYMSAHVLLNLLNELRKALHFISFSKQV